MVGASGQVINLNGLCGVTPPTKPATGGSGNASSANTPGVYRVKIKRREGGTPVIDVRFNGKQTFEMIVDTGASSTVLTTRMAGLLKVVPVGIAKVDTASQKGVEVPLGYVTSVEVAGAKAQNLLVAVAGPELDIGLLGQDFFKNYDVVIRKDAIEFHHR
jgi:predicted aspartyl protease